VIAGCFPGKPVVAVGARPRAGKILLVFGFFNGLEKELSNAKKFSHGPGGRHTDVAVCAGWFA
jgi:hypothetical protein